MMKQLLSAIVMSGVVAMAAEYRVEGQYMPEKGKWTLDKVNKILYAQDKGYEAKGEFTAAEAGELTLWANVMTMDQGWRKSEVIINDVSYGKFGDQKGLGLKSGSLYWEKGAKKVAVKAGLNKVVIKSASGAARFAGIALTDDEAFDPNKGYELVAGAAPVSIELKGVEFEAESGWTAGGGVICCQKGGATATAVVEVEEDTNVVVWGCAVSHGGGSRKVTLVVNGMTAGTFGDEKLGAGQKAGAQIWTKCPAIVHLNKGENEVKVVGTPYGRLVKVALTNDAAFDPSAKK